MKHWSCTKLLAIAAAALFGGCATGADTAIDDGGETSGDAGVIADTGVLGPPTCPPEGPFGIEVGDKTVDVTLLDCDGQPHAIHDLCAFNAGWIFAFAGW